MRKRLHLFAGALGVTSFLMLRASLAVAQPAPVAQQPVPRLSDPRAVAELVLVEKTVQVAVEKSDQWIDVKAGVQLLPGNRVRTLADSRAVVRFSDRETVPMGPNSLMLIQAPPGRKRGFEALRGLFYFFHRDKPEDFGVRTPRGGLIIRGTEVVLEVEEGDGPTRISVLEGAVDLTNEVGQLSIAAGQAALLEVGQPPRETPMLEPVNLLQWCLYYPAVLDHTELHLGDATERALSASLLAYQQGDLLAALAAFPANRVPVSDPERIFLAALKLSVGQVSEVERLMEGIDTSAPASSAAPLAIAVRTLIAVVKGRPLPAFDTRAASSASRLLVESYAAQARHELEAALVAARQATNVSPGFAFAWARVAELEFSFGRTAAARRAVERSLELALRNAQAVALLGFLRAAEGRTTAALEEFDRAIALDRGLGNAWLGRGLCRIRRGDRTGGLADLQMAATVEPNRAVLRSYLGKAFDQARDPARARHELELAKQWDPNDPTAWLYAALLDQHGNRINEAIGSLERSQELNDNRRVYRSELLLDQDASVRGANLATVYRDAGMLDVSRREAAHAVNTEYGNASAHLFLADSYNQLRDPRQVNLRYETPWLSEYLLANLLAPVGAGTLSPYVTQQEYSRLFERNRLGLVSSTEYGSQGDWTQSAVQHGLYDNFAYALEGLYRWENGHRPNNDLEQLTTNLKLKHQLTPQDNVFFQATYYHAETGDVTPYYDESQANRGLRTEETQEPLLLAGARHQWSPGNDTLVIGGRLQDTFRVRNPTQPLLSLQRDPAGNLIDVLPFAAAAKYRSDAELYTAEVQQLLERGPHTLIAGARFQTGQFEAANGHAVLPGALDPSEFISQDLTQRIRSDFQRLTAYGYYGLQPVESLWLLGGLSYDRLTQPLNFRVAPLTDGETTTDEVQPKAGLMWTPRRGTRLRAAYARSLSGVAFDQSFQLEPAQIAGFLQTYRSLIPESLPGVGAVGGARFETYGLALDQSFPTRTYLGLSGEWLQSDADRTVGVYERVLAGPISKSSTRQRLDYYEPSFTLTLNQLLAEEWALGARYRFSYANLDTRYLGIPATLFPLAHTDEAATLHQLTLFALFNHSSGFFTQAEGVWSVQDNDGYSPARPGDNFWQFNYWAGYRFAARRVEVRLGVLNLTDQDYHLNPLNLTTELPHERTFVASLRFSF